MDAPRVNVAFNKLNTNLSSSSAEEKTSISSTSSHLSPAFTRRLSTEQASTANIEPQSPSPTHHSSPSSRDTSSSPHTRLRVVTTPESDTPATSSAAAEADRDCVGGLLEMSGVSIASQLSAALDMKTKTTNSAVAAAVTAAAAAAELLHAGTPPISHTTQSQKIKKYTCVDNTDYKNNNNNENNMNDSCSDRNSCEQRILSPTITTTTETTTMTGPKSSLRGFRRRGSPRLQQPQHQTDKVETSGLGQLKTQSQRHKKQGQQQKHSLNKRTQKQQQQKQPIKKYSYYLAKKFCRLEHERQLAEAEKLQHQQQQLYATTKENFLLTLNLLAVVRRNASDKLRLIQMVHDNPILWDSRLPNFKGAEEEKNRAWEMIGKEFNAPGRRVARAFKSLRESYRRELAHVKLMGNGFKPKWSLYDAMDFLRDVIRERKGGSHAAEQAAIGLNLSAFSQHLNNNNSNSSSNKAALKLSAMHSSFNESALNLSKCSPGLNMSHEDYYYYVKPELDMAAAAAAAAAAHAGSNGIGHPAMPPRPLPAHQSQQPHHQQQQQQQQQHSQNASAHDSRVSSTRNDSNTQNSTTFDDLDASSVRSGDETSVRNADMSNQGSDEVEELEAIDADFPYPLILDANSPRSMSAAGVQSGGGGMKRKRRDLNGDAMDGNAGDDEDDYEGQMMQQHRHLRQQNGGSISGVAGGGNGGGGGGGGSGSLGGMGGCMLDMPQPQTVREVLNSKFCGFISAKLNSMEDTEADNLMNKILMLLVQSQTQTQTQACENK